MAYDRAASVASARRVVHKTMAVPAVYRDDCAMVTTTLRVRWHSRLALQGNIIDGGYADFLEGVKRLIFNATELREKNITLNQYATVTIRPIGKDEDVVLTLDRLEPSEGPEDVIWGVT